MPAPSRTLAPVVRVPFLILAVLAAMALVFAVSTLLVSWLSGVPVLGGRGLLFGVISGLIACLFAVVFHVRREVLVLPIGDRERFLERLTGELDGLGYRLVHVTSDLRLFRPRFGSFLFGGQVRVEIDESSARVLGPRVYLERLRKWARLDERVDQAYRSRAESRLNQNSRVLQRVRLTMRVPAAQWHQVTGDVINAIAEQGGDVVCDVRFFIQSEQGISERAVERLIRDRLRSQSIPVSYHGDAVSVLAN